MRKHIKNFSVRSTITRQLTAVGCLLTAGMIAFTGGADTSRSEVKKEKRERVVDEENLHPNYIRPEDPTIEELTYTWRSDDGAHDMIVMLNLEKEMYDYYRSLDRFLIPFDGQMSMYVNDLNNRELLRNIADQIIRQCDEHGYDKEQYLQEAINFVQHMRYELDSDTRGTEEYYKYPIETLYDGNGDCEDTSILLAGLVRELGYDVIYIWYLDGHMAVGVKCEGYDGLSFEYEGEDYYYIETTSSGWNIGEEPESDTRSLKYVFPLTEE